MFSPRKLGAAAIATIGGDLWSYLDGGQERADYYLGTDGTPTRASSPSPATTASPLPSTPLN